MGDLGFGCQAHERSTSVVTSLAHLGKLYLASLLVRLWRRAFRPGLFLFWFFPLFLFCFHCLLRCFLSSLCAILGPRLRLSCAGFIVIFLGRRDRNVSRSFPCQTSVVVPRTVCPHCGVLTVSVKRRGLDPGTLSGLRLFRMKAPLCDVRVHVDAGSRKVCG